MSAFVVDDKTINQVVTFMSKSDDMIPDRITGGAARLGKAMRELNENAVNYRYDNDAFMIPDDPYVYQLEEADVAQVLQSIGSFLYQCSEGEYHKDPLFKKLSKLNDELGAKC